MDFVRLPVFLLVCFANERLSWQETSVGEKRERERDLCPVFIRQRIGRGCIILVGKLFSYNSSEEFMKTTVSFPLLVFASPFLASLVLHTL